MTLLEMTNKVLRALREDTVEALSDEYPIFVAQLVNEAKEDLEDDGPWYALRTTISASMADSETSVALSGTNHRSYLLWDDGGPGGRPSLPMAFLTTADEERRLEVIPLTQLLALRESNPDADNDTPQAIAFARGASSLTMHVFPACDGAHTFNLYMVVPQDELEASDEITVPGEPVWREALVRAMEERGEELAGPIDRAVERAKESRAAAIMRDFGADPLTVEAQ